MYAILKSGGKQYRVSAGTKLQVEKLNAQIGSDVVFDQILLVVDGENVSTGKPLVAGASVTAKVLSHNRGEKLKIYKMRRRKHFRKTLGHRQDYTQVEISAIAT